MQPERDVTWRAGRTRPTLQEDVARAGWGASPRALLAGFHCMKIKCLLKQRRNTLFLWKGVWYKHLHEGGGVCFVFKEKWASVCSFAHLHPLLSLHRHMLCLWVSPSFLALHSTTSCPPELPGDTTDSFLSLVTCKVPAKQTQGFSCTTINSSAPHRNAGCSEQPSTAVASQTSLASPGYPWLSSSTLTQHRTSY